MSKHSSTAVTRPFSSLEPKAVRKLSRETWPESHAVSKQQNNSLSLQDLKTPKLNYKTPTQKLKRQTKQLHNSVRPTKESCLKHNFSPNDWVAPQLGLPEQSSTGVRGETRAACARAQWHIQNGMPREEHLDRAQVRGAAHSDVKRGGTHPCMH